MSSPHRAIAGAHALVEHYAELIGEPTRGSDPFLAAQALKGSGLKSATLGTYAWALRTQGVDTGTRHRGSPGSLRYTRAQLASFLAAARAMADPAQRRAALVMISATAGAGARPGELLALVPGDLSPGLLTLGGRAVPVADPWAAILLANAPQAGEHLFTYGSAKRDRRSYLSDFAARLMRRGAPAPFSMARARATYLCALIQEGRSATEVMRLAGIAEVESLLRYSRQVPGAPGTKAELRRWAR
ncbi:MAG: hypothetical protein M0Z88_00050 [Actinomycetota bacterium]|nr:hypothetical protein [Actinomycetota bacterium]